MNRIVAGIVSGAALIGLYVYEDQLLSLGCPAIDYSDSPEARQWIRNNESQSCLASNRFGSSEAALEFVNSLYQAGATRVVVPADVISDDGVEVYCDALVVIMPADPAQRRSVRTLCDREIRREGFDPSEEPDADQVYLWWD